MLPATIKTSIGLNVVEIGDRFFTPEDAIEKALNYSAVYDSTGLKD